MSYDFRVVSLNLRTKHLYTSMCIILIVIRKNLTKHLYTSMCIILIVIRKNLSKFKSAYFFQSLKVSLKFRN